MKEVSSGDGVAAGVGEIARAQLYRGEVSQREDADTTGGRWELIARSSERGSCYTVIAGLEVNVAGGSEQVSVAVIDQ